MQDSIKPIYERLKHLSDVRAELMLDIKRLDHDMDTLKRAMEIMTDKTIDNARTATTRSQQVKLFGNGVFPSLVLEALREATEPLTASQLGDIVLSKLKDVPPDITGAKLNGRINTMMAEHAKRGTVKRVEHEGGNFWVVNR